MKKSIMVQKFGGTSVGSPERIKNVAKRIVESKNHYEKLVVVVSAMGKTTDELVRLSKEMSTNPTPREYDALVSTGENVSASLLAMCLNDMGHKALSLTGPQAGVKTENLHVKAKITTVDSSRLEKELNDGNVVIVTGFQGLNPEGDVTTIGRGGSDTSAVVLAAALRSETCEIYTDVDGVYTTDPRKVKEASKLPEIGYEEMLEMASLGAGVLHPRAVECAKENNIILHVRSSLEPTEGTLVKEVRNMESAKAVSGVAVNQEEAIISILKVSDNPGVAGTLFTALADKGVNVDMIIQNVEQEGNNNISFSVHEDDLEAAKAITEDIANKMGAEEVRTDNSIAKISIVGIGMISKPGVAAQMFSALGKAGINIKRITTSEIKVSCAIERKDALDALNLLHKEFNLDK